MFYCYILMRRDKPEHRTIDALSSSLLYRPYYVGKGSGSRVYKHRRIKTTKHPKDAVTKYLLDKGFDFKDLFVIYPCEDEQSAFALEERVISEIGLDNLTNIARGGVGGCAGLRFKLSEEAKQKIRANTIRHFQDPEYRARHIARMKARHLPEYGSKISAKLAGAPKSSIHRARISAALKGKEKTKLAIDNAAIARAKHKVAPHVDGKEYRDLVRFQVQEILARYGIELTIAMFYRKMNKMQERNGVKFMIESSTTIPQGSTRKRAEMGCIHP